MNVLFRPYQPVDEFACLSIFDGNTPKFFGVGERPGFETFLKKQPCPFFVVEQDADLVACGGYCAKSAPEVTTLAWGMVRNDLHKQGLGTFLLKKDLPSFFQKTLPPA